MKQRFSGASRRPAPGFSLLELLVVLVILALLGTVVAPHVINQISPAKMKTAKVQIRDLEQAIDLFKLDVGRFPTRDEGLNALVNNPGVPGWNGPYLRKKNLPADPWGGAYHYDNPGRNGEIDIYTYAADGAPGGDGENADIGNWN